MNKYYITFGQNHYNLKGECMKDYWLLLEADNPIQAIQEYDNKIRNWMELNMGNKDLFANIYEESSFDKTLFPKGEYDKII